ncbi:ubiquinol--cytochrome-c reductase subunit [Martiniozyma asiatica (nom. inval.)]|nr:ubiquinol--cytochrome-c reductase subunit [Martiniozyma asiatica]
MLSRRLFSTSSTRFAKTSVSKLSNGITVVTKPSTGKSAIGVYLNSGSRAENPYNSGISTLTGNLVTSSGISRDALSSGVKLYSSNAKEVTGLATATYEQGNSSAALNAIKNVIGSLDSIVSDSVHLSAQKEKAIAVADAFENSPKDMVIEHMIATAFQGTSLALPKYGKTDSLEILESEDIKTYLSKNLVASNLAVVGVGSELDHEALVKFASELNVASGVRAAYEPALFLGSDVRLRDDTLPQAHVAISVKTPGAQDQASFYNGLVAAQINGTYLGQGSPFSSFVGSQLAQFLEENHLIDSFEHFQLAFSDVGLWGAYLASSNIGCVDETVHFALKNWNKLSTGTVKQIELEKAKAELKLNLLKAKASPVQAAEAAASEIFAKGYAASEDEIIQSIDAVTDSSIQTWAQKNLWDQDIAMAGNGQIEALFDYGRVRNDMAALRW